MISAPKYSVIAFTLVALLAAPFAAVRAQEQQAPTTQAPVYEAPSFFSPSMTQDEIDALSPEQKQELGMYLSRHALVAPGVVMTIETVDASLDKVAYGAGDTATATLAWTSPVATESLAPNGDTAGLPSLTFTVSLIDNAGAVCGGPITSSVLVSDTNPSFSVSMTTDCVRPQVLVYATDWNDTSIGSWVVEHPTVKEAYDGWMTVWIILIALAALVVLGVVVRRVNGSCPSFANVLKRK